ncbi:MAG: leucine-rich repeat protein [Opitutales bacterium]|nr:leucine-rich repeat protein [Opitutales bacterium]
MKSFSFAILFFAFVVPASAFSLRDLGDGAAEISAYSGGESTLAVPATLDGKRITRIGANAFFGNANLQSVSLPEGVEEIAPLAFAHCGNLNRVSFPRSLKKIGARAFFACEKLPEIELPDSAQTLGEEAFAFCSALEKISAPPTIANLGENAFPLTSPALFPPSKFPAIEIESAAVELLDPSGDCAIDGAEICNLRVPVSNAGEADAYGCCLKIALKTPNAELAFPESLGITKIPAGEKVLLEIPVSASRALAAGTAEFSFYVEEPNGLGSEEKILALETRPFVAPAVKIVDFLVSGQGDSVLKKNAPFDLQLFLQNTTAGTAEEVSVTLELPNGILVLDGKQTQKFPALRGGAAQPLEFSLLVPRRYRGEEIPVRVKISEKYGEFAENWETTLRLNSSVATAKTTLVPTGTANAEIATASFRSAVDKDIPVNPETPARNIFVAVVANEKYRYVAPVNFAENDGQIFREYCRKTLGVPEKQIRFFKNATVGDMNLALNWLETRGKLPGAELIFYYSGHGVPDDSDRTAYLLPVDGDPSGLGFLRSLNDVYAQLARSRAKIAAVFLDACFSGMRRDNAPLVSAKGVRRAASSGDISRLPSNLVVFTAASGDQTAHFANAEKHGLFTYVLLKKLKETRGNVSFAELAEYLRKIVPEQSLKLGDFEQTPSVLAHDDFPHWDEKLYGNEK